LTEKSRFDQTAGQAQTTNATRDSGQPAVQQRGEMPFLLDTNVLVYAINADAPKHETSHSLVETAVAGGVAAVLVPQVLLEFLAVVTSARRVSRPLDTRRAWEHVAALRSRLPVLDVKPAALTVFGELITSRRPAGRAIFDLFLAAQMRTYNVGVICTYNVADFATFPHLEVITPENALERNGL
jgi:toxin-antitoxin system PIN domain toxin